MASITDETGLLREFVTQNSHDAFATLVSNHTNLVYSTAMRLVGNPDQAQEITQAVFIILAKKAHLLRQGTILSAWLYQTTRLTASNFLRTEARRRRREQEAYLEAISTSDSEPDPQLWMHIAPLLDDALAHLNAKDRAALILRFFEGKEMREIGAALNTSDDAAKMRVSRALEKMRTYFGKRGIATPVAGLAVVISANSVQAAPVGLASSVSILAAMKGAAPSSSTIALIKGTLKVMFWTKYRASFAAAAILFVATGTTLLFAINPTPGADNKTGAAPQDDQASDLNAALIRAAGEGNTALVTELLSKGAQVNVPNKEGWTGWLAGNRHPEVMELLLENGADVNTEYPKGSGTALEGGTALIVAAGEGRADAVRVLLARGANVNAINKFGYNAWLAGNRHPDVLKLLLDKGVDVNARYPAGAGTDLEGATALILAAGEGRKDAITALLNKGADVNARGKNGLTALGVASQSRNAEIVKMLRQHGGTE